MERMTSPPSMKSSSTPDPSTAPSPDDTDFGSTAWRLFRLGWSDDDWDDPDPELRAAPRGTGDMAFVEVLRPNSDYDDDDDGKSDLEGSGEANGGHARPMGDAVV